jgi:hypothetical protein
LFQRDYSWTKDNWDELWADVLDVFQQAGMLHYLGSIVVQRDGDKQFQIIDGQQRVTTLSLLVLAIIKRLEALTAAGQQPEANRERARQFREDYIGRKDAVSLLYNSKLTLNQHNDGFYQANLVQLEVPPMLNRENDSNRRLWDAFRFFDDALSKSGIGASGEQLAALAQCLGERLLFIKISVADELSAYTVFETLNYDGLRLTVTDLLKNYLFSRFTAGSNDLYLINERWRRIVEAVGLDRFGTFLRHYWLANHSLIREERLFKAIRQQVQTAADARDLLKGLGEAAGLYAALTDAEDDYWDTDDQARRDIRALNLFGVKLHLPLSLAVELAFAPAEARRVLRTLVALTFRYNVVGKLQTNRLEDLYQQAALAVTRGEAHTAADVWQRLAEVYIPDETFRQSFAAMRLSAAPRTRKLLRYILFGLENQLASTDRDAENDPATIEHIVPDTPESLPNWPAFTPEEHQLLRDRIGNYTLLEAAKNRAINQDAYALKQAVYQTSQYGLSQKITFPEFTPKQLKDRQRDLARVAATVWKTPFNL